MSLELSNVSSKSHIFTLSQDSSQLSMESDAKSFEKQKKNMKNANIAYQKFISKIGMLFDFETQDLDALYNKIAQCTRHSDKLVESSDQEILDMIQIAKELQKNHSLLKNMINLLDSKYLSGESNKKQVNQSTFSTTKEEQIGNQVSFKKKQENFSIKHIENQGDPFISESESISNFFRTPVQQLNQYRQSNMNKTDQNRPFFQKKQSRRSSICSQKRKRSLSKQNKKKFQEKLLSLYDQMSKIRSQINEIQERNWKNSSNSSLGESNPPTVLQSEMVAPQQNYFIHNNQLGEQENQIVPQRERNNSDYQNGRKAQEFIQINTIDRNYHTQQQEEEKSREENRQRKKSKEKVQAALQKLENRNKCLQKYLYQIENSLTDGKTKHTSESDHEQSISNVMYAEPKELAEDMIKNRKLQKENHRNQQQNHIDTKQNIDLHEFQSKEKSQQHQSFKTKTDPRSQHSHFHQKLMKNQYQDEGNQEDYTSIDECSLFGGASRKHQVFNNQHQSKDQNIDQILIPKKSGSLIFKETRNVESKMQLSEDGTGRHSGQQIKKIKDTVAEMFKKFQSISENENESKQDENKTRKIIMKDSGVGDFSIYEPTGNQKKPMNFSYQSVQSSNMGNISEATVNKRLSQINQKMLITFHPEPQQQHSRSKQQPKYAAYLSPTRNRFQTPVMQYHSFLPYQNQHQHQNQNQYQSQNQYQNKQSRERSRSIQYRNIKQSSVRRLSVHQNSPPISRPPYQTQKIFMNPVKKSPIIQSPNSMNFSQRIMSPPLPPKVYNPQINNNIQIQNPQLNHIRSNPNLNRANVSYSQIPQKLPYPQVPTGRVKAVTTNSPYPQTMHPSPNNWNQHSPPIQSSFIQSKIIPLNNRRHRNPQNPRKREELSHSLSRSGSKRSRRGISITDKHKRYLDDSYY